MTSILYSRVVLPAAVVVAAAACLVVVEAQSGQRAPVDRTNNAQAAGDLEVIQLRPNFFMIAGAGGNVAVQVGEDGILVVDTGLTSRAAAVLAAIRKISPAPIRYIVNTSADPDHVGGNEALVNAGQTLFGGWTTGNAGAFGRAGASVVATEQVLLRMSTSDGGRAPYPEAAWPTEAFYLPRKYMFFNGEAVEFLHQPAAHTGGDSVVFFRRSDVIVAGDILDLRHFPVIDVAQGGTIQGEIAALSRLVDIAVPSVPLVSREAGTLVIPGHGHVGDQIDLAEYRDMLTIIRDRVRDLIKAGRTLDQIKAAAPARGYTGRYGGTTGSWTTDRFIEAVHRSLLQEKS
jgi:glyoxylase-like metal-dependent hydrolase (beta-lactamase superfamily II)